MVDERELRDPEEDKHILVESLRLIVQSQMILDELQRNLRKLEDLIENLDLPEEQGND